MDQEWTPLTFNISALDADVRKVNPDDLELVIKVVSNKGSNQMGNLDLGNHDNHADFTLNSDQDRIKLTLREKSSQKIHGYVTFVADDLEKKQRVNFKQWVALKDTPLDDEFSGVLGRDERSKGPRIQIVFEALPKLEKSKKKKKTKETTERETGSHDSSVPTKLRSPEDEDGIQMLKSKMRILKADPGPIQNTSVETKVADKILNMEERKKQPSPRRDREERSREKQSRDSYSK